MQRLRGIADVDGVSANGSEVDFIKIAGRRNNIHHSQRRTVNIQLTDRRSPKIYSCIRTIAGSNRERMAGKRVSRRGCRGLDINKVESAETAEIERPFEI